MAAQGNGDAEVPETHVLAVASHVTAGYVGNTMATFCMQALGCEVSAIHTVNFSNHTAYKTFKGRKTPPEEIAELYTGLKNARLDDFDMLLSGYCPSAGVIEEVGKIGRDAKLRGNTKPGSFFWILDPVMGDNGRIYVAEECVPAYKGLLKDADLILPNQFEAELLSDVKIRDFGSLVQAVEKLHQEYTLPHVLITSVRLPPTAVSTPALEEEKSGNTGAKLSIVGSTATSEGKPRLFRITVPALPIFFSGTGDMFAALLVARLRQAVQTAGVSNKPSWQSPDDVAGPDLPLAKATEMVLASMHAVLKDTERHYQGVAEGMEGERELNEGKGEEAEREREMGRHLRLTRAAEVRVVRNVGALRSPPGLGRFRAEGVEGE
ncbi:hypothetical protein PRZ48_009400 [Zasmidium cellare]|uniref:pyridoxal kinase n=1 Tax=Zasmidium cellare TaxID=395010 RepID=A0ABR0EBL7_ZASCE|nr:hypothetical protein PRZ48_009400 [Zasmidium cellare]